MRQLFIKPFLLWTVLFSQVAFSHGLTQEGYFVFDKEQKYLRYFSEQLLTVDHPSEEGYEVYGPKGLGEFLTDLGVSFEHLEEDANEKVAADYPNPEEIYEKLKGLVQKNSDILQWFSIGKSRQNKELFVVKISDNVHIDEKEPEFKYIGNMHGNEIVGRDMLVLFIEDLVKRYRAGEPGVVSAVNNTEIFVMPTMNPDGSSARRRGNDRWQDLNRNFPDFTTADNQNTPAGREPETVAVMNWQGLRNFSLSANFHGGSKVVNYPWDTQADPAPLTDLIKDLSLLYASTVPGFYDNPRFAQGITNGYRWYHVDGGMQDWSYFWHNDLQVTIELSNNKWPDYSEIPNYYNDNKEALLSFLLKIHQGAGFYLKNAQSKGRVVIVDSDQKEIGSFGYEKGEFYKVLPAGTYRFKVDSESGEHFEFSRVVSDHIVEPLEPNYEVL